MFATTASRKVLVPFATLVAAGAVAVGSGATFTSTSDSSISATSGTLVHVNNKDKATLTITDLKPGVSKSGELTITNTGSLDSALTMNSSAIGDQFGPGAVTLKIESIHGVTTEIEHNASFASVPATLSLGDLDADVAGDFITVRFTVTMAEAADNTNQGKSAYIDLGFVTTQTNDATETGVSWVPGV